MSTELQKEVKKRSMEITSENRAIFERRVELFAASALQGLLSSGDHRQFSEVESEFIPDDVMVEIADLAADYAINLAIVLNERGI